MSCGVDEWNVRFPNVIGTDGPVQLLPYEMDFKRSQTELSYCRMTFRPEVGEMLKPQTRYPGGYFRKPRIAEIMFGDEVIESLYFKPDFATYTSDATYLEFHDAQNLLDDGVVDKAWPAVTLRNAYQYAFDQRVDNGIIKGLKFSEVDIAALYYQNVAEKKALATYETPYSEYHADLTTKLLDGVFQIDLDQLSPYKAIWQLNKRFNLTAWIGHDLYLWIGVPHSIGLTHYAAPNDERVWRYQDENVNIRHSREPIRSITVQGAWVDEPGIGTGEDVLNIFNPSKSTADVQATGIAYRTDVGYGRSIKIAMQDAKRDVLPALAEAEMLNFMADENKGTIEIDTQLSAPFTPLQSVEAGDKIHIVPDDRMFDNPTADSGRIGDEPDKESSCNSLINNETYLITSVQHDIDSSGYWSLTLEVSLVPRTDDINSVFRYFDPKRDGYITANEFFDGNWFEEGATIDATGQLADHPFIPP